MNRLAHETSPYLRQHADNPVDWYPWGTEALQRAREERKPILLSVGYAACHWCHVMAHESFEDAATAALMNRHFINIKVDREERPDLDRLYQLAQQMLSGRSGGWPLTMFLMHGDQRPFFGGTYFPKTARYGMPAFGDLLLKVADHYRDHQEQLAHSAASVADALADMNPPPAPADALNDEPLRACRAQLERTLDPQWGGFGQAPKFPHAALLQRLLRDWHASAGDVAPDLQALYMTTLTLTRMAEGGLFDQLGGGFYRYSVDERWAIPHFEKMLYDNATLLPAYAEAALATGEPLYASVVDRTVDWLLAEMRAPDGGFYSSLDADSEGHEGRYYVWEAAQLDALLEADEKAVAVARFGFDAPPNFEGHAHHAIVARSLEQIATEQQRNVADTEALLASATRKLLAERARRVRPGLDDKRLTSWNALAIRGLAIAARCRQRNDWAEAAGETLDFLRREHWRDGRLRATSAGGEARLAAYLDDYVFLADAILELQTVRFKADELTFAVELIEVVLKHFADASAGGFFFTADDHETLISRPKSFSDDALPAGNGATAWVLQRLGWLLGETRYLEAAEATLRAAWPALARYPHGHATLLAALEEYLLPTELVILRGPSQIIEPWRKQLAAVYAPRRWVLAVSDDASGALPAALADKPSQPDGVAYVCRGSTCSPPLTSLAEIAATLAAPDPKG